MQPVNCLKTTPGLSDCKPYQAIVLCNHSSNGPTLHLQLPKLGTQEKLAPSLSHCSAECGIRESQDCDKAIRSPHKECCFSLALRERALAQHPVYPCGLPNHHRAGLRLQATRHMLQCLVSTCLSRASFPHLASGGAQQGATCAASRRVSASNKACSQRPRSLSTASRSCHPITRTPLAPARTCTHHAPVDKAATVACLYAWQLPLLNGRSHRLHALRAIFVVVPPILPTAVTKFTAAIVVIPPTSHCYPCFHCCHCGHSSHSSHCRPCCHCIVVFNQKSCMRTDPGTCHVHCSIGTVDSGVRLGLLCSQHKIWHRHYKGRQSASGGKAKCCTSWREGQHC
jgi:hypothetical protein